MRGVYDVRFLCSEHWQRQNARLGDRPEVGVGSGYAFYQATRLSGAIYLYPHERPGDSGHGSLAGRFIKGAWNNDLSAHRAFEFYRNLPVCGFSIITRPAINSDSRIFMSSTSPASYDITPSLQGYVRVDNILNRHYEEVLYFRHSGAVGVRWRWVTF